MTKALFIVDMQDDFILPGGKLSVPDALDITVHVSEIIIQAMKYHQVCLGSMDRHFKTDLELKNFPPHCMDKQHGQGLYFGLPAFKEIHIPNKVSEYGAFEQIPHGQLIEYIKDMEEENSIVFFEKQTTDVFTNPHIDFVLEKLNIDTVYVVGVAVEFCVKDAVMGFLKRGIKVKIIVDAVEGIDIRKKNLALKQMYGEGADLITTEQALKELSE
jgi:nicotinamidase/pyrazinamidase